jgi:hypothetical protein
MYINKVDEIIDTSLDNFYKNYILKNNVLEKIEKEQNFVKYQLKINQTIEDFLKTIKETDIRKIVNNVDNVKRIIEIIKRYTAYYIFLSIGYFYKWDKQIYINNLIEFTLNQTRFDFKIENFFNSENNNMVIKFFDLIKDIEFILGIEDIKSSILVTPKGKEKYKNSIMFLNELGQDFVIDNLKNGQEVQKSHNLIKIIVFKILYQQQEKADVSRILEEIEEESSNYTYIEIVLPKTKAIDYSAIENLLTPYEIRKGIASEIYEFMTYQNKKNDMDFTIEDKIIELINSGILVPISEDFLRYHKDTEKYETEKRVEKKHVKKEDTKLRYIITKLDNASDLYSDIVKKNEEKQKNILKLFYQPLEERKAVLINDLEEVKIINKIHHQGKYVEFYTDLINYRQYPYVNFKEFKKWGISVMFEQTKDIVRNTSFEYLQYTKNNGLHTRVGIEDQMVNIVGFMGYDPLSNHLECIKSGKVLDVRKFRWKKNNKIYSTNNGINAISHYLKYTLFKDKLKYLPVSWMFDINVDALEPRAYEAIDKNNFQEIIKVNIARLYDDIIKYVYQYIKNKIKNIKYYSITSAKEILYNVTKKFLLFETNSDYLNKLEELIIFGKTLKNPPEYDKKEDVYPGLESQLLQVLKIPEVKQEKEHYTIKIKKEEFVQEKILDTQKEMFINDTIPENFDTIFENIVKNDKDDYNEAICQHNITWQMLINSREKNSTRFQKELYDFMQQYVFENKEQEFICKSCGYILNIKNYVADGFYDEEEGRFKALNISMDIPLEDIIEYEKVNKTLKTVDKILEKICSIGGIVYYVGATTTIKWRRKNIIKNVIDMLLVHNKTLKPIYKERNELAIKKYGIRRELSNLYFFEVDNNIFIYSSKEKDYYKLIKGNNVIVYILIMLMIELNDGQILLLGREKGSRLDKICNYGNYIGGGIKLLENLRIIKNKNGDIVNVTNYPVLAYLIYYFSCVLTKYKLWYVTEQYREKKFSITMQKMIIHTFVDTINSILEVNTSTTKKRKNYLYDIISVKFFMKLSSLFSDTTLIKNIDDMYKSLTTVKKQEKIGPIKKPEVLTIRTTKKYSKENYLGYNYIKRENIYVNHKTRKYYKGIKRMNELNYKTNCPSGNFHQWITFDNILKCKECGTTTLDIISDSIEKKDLMELNNNYYLKFLDKLIKKYCETNQIDKLGKCREQYNDSDLTDFSKNLENKITKRYQKQITKQNDESTKLEEERNKYNTIKKNIKKLYLKSIESGNIYDNLVKTIESIIGQNVNINNLNIWLKDNAYIIDHDFLNNELEKSFVITDKDTKINYKENHPFFATNVIYYTDKKKGVMDLFYNAVTNIYLGYKETSKDYVLARSESPKYIKTNYSVITRLNLLGFDSMYIDVSEFIQENEKLEKPLNKQLLTENIVNYICTLRIFRLKKIITMIQRVLYRLKYTKNIKKTSDEIRVVDKINDFTNIIVDKYKKTLSDNLITDTVFEQWDTITKIFYYKKPKDEINIDISTNWINARDIQKIDVIGNILLYYIIGELEKIIKLNNNKFIQVTVVNFIVDLINQSYDYYNIDKQKINFEITRFNYILKSGKYIFDTEKQGQTSIGIYQEDLTQEELDDPTRLEEIEDEKEAFDAIDFEGSRELEQDDEGLRDFANIEDRE